MSDEFKSRLERLHGARSRATERKEDDKAQGVYSADDAVEHDESGQRTSDKPSPSRPEGPKNRDGQPWLDERHGPDERYGHFELRELLDRPTDRVFDAADLEPSAAGWRNLAFLDTETTGLSETDYAFCVGVGFWRDDEFLVRIYHMRDGDDDEAMLEALSDGLDGVAGLCTFNGSSFDVPLLERQYREAGLESPLGGLLHLDLLPVSRQVWPDLDSHSMESLEERKLAAQRTDDVPGSEVPRRWAQFVRSGRFSVLSGVFEHNRKDVLALVSLACALDSDLGGTDPKAGSVPETQTTRPGPPDFEPAPGEGGGTEKERRGATVQHQKAKRQQGSGDAQVPPEDEPLPDDDSVTSKLTRQYALRDRSSKAKKQDSDQQEGESGARAESRTKPKERTRRRSLSSEPEGKDESSTAGPETKRQRPGQRVATLRDEASSVIESEGIEEAADLLHRIVALTPDHPWALERLVKLHEARGEAKLAGHYRARLQKTSPF